MKIKQTTCIIDDCISREYARGLCNRHYKKREEFGIPKYRGDFQDRFWANVIKKGEDECWEWTASNSNGYGIIWVNRRSRKATHVSLFIHTGKWPTLHVLHSCDNPPCVNPNHLREGTHAENMKEARDRGRLPMGQGRNFAKLLDAEVIAIREALKRGERSKDLMHQYDVSVQTVWRIRKGMTWSHLGL